MKMKPNESEIKRSPYYTLERRSIVLLFLMSGIIPLTLPNPLPLDECQYRLFKDGDAIIGALISVYQNQEANKCHIIDPQWLGHLEAIVFAIEEINKNKALLSNFTLGYDIRDICGSKTIATREAYQFAMATTMNCKSVTCLPRHDCICDFNGTSSKNYTPTYPVIAVVGALPSRVAIPLANFLQAVEMPLIETYATSEELSSSNCGSFFRTIPSDANQAKAIADIIEHFGWRYVATVAVDDSYGRFGVKALERESMERKTFCTELFGYIPLLKYSHKAKLIASSLKDRKTIRVIIVWCYSAQGKSLLREAVKQGLTDHIWLFTETIAMMKLEYLSSIFNVSTSGVHIGVKETLKNIIPEKFLQNLQSKALHNHSKDKHIWWRDFWKSFNDVPRGNIPTFEFLPLVHNDYVMFMIDAIYSVAHVVDRMLRCKLPNGSEIIDEHSCPLSIMDNKIRLSDVIQYLKTVEFEGLTGKIQFDSRGDPVEANYDIVYFNITERNGSKRVTKDAIGWWHKNSKDRLKIHDNVLKLWENNKDVGKIPSSTCTEECKPGQWKENITKCCWKCLECTDGSVSETEGALSCTKCTKIQMSNFKRTQCIPLPITNIDWSDTLAVILTMISVLGIVIDVSVFGILLYFRDTPVVKALNKVCTLVLLLGIALCFGMTLLHNVRPSSGLCSVLKPLRYVVYTLCCSALFLKTMQIVHAFNISKLKNWVKVFICSTKRQVIGLTAIITIEVLLGAVWILLDPPYAHVTIFPKSHVFITCVSFRGTLGKVLDSLMLVYLVLVACCCIYYAFRARNLPANFNEAKHISFTLYIFLLSWITYYPVDYAAEGWYVAVLSGATLLLSSYGILICMLGPKVYVIIWHPKKNTIEVLRSEMRQNHSTPKVINYSSSARPKENS